MADRALTGVLLVGGRSRRFGSPKALAVLDGETLGERAWRLLGEVCDERFAVGHADGLPFATMADAEEGGGPLAGIVAGLRAASHDVAIVVPVDMPLLTPAALRSLADACRDAAIPQTGPLPGAYAKRALPWFEKSLAAGELALSYVVSQVATTVVELDAALLSNVNVRDDLEAVRSTFPA